ncbi:unnamed protein product [Prunus armeniaca]
MIPFLHLSNELAIIGHRISFLTPKKAQIQLQHLNLHPDLITFCPITVPHVEGLYEGIEFASEVPTTLIHLFYVAVDQNCKQIQEILKASVLDHKIDMIFYYFVHWVPEFTWKLGVGIKSIYYITTAAAVHAFSIVPARNYSPSLTGTIIKEQLRDLPSGYQSQHVVLLPGCEIHSMLVLWKPFGLAGSVVFCAFESQLILEKDQFQELVLGFELTGLPFFVVLKPPAAYATIEEALPDEFEERVKGRGVVFWGWV